MSTIAMPRSLSPSPTFGQRSYSPSATPAPFLTSPIAERPLPRRVHSLQPPRPAPYPVSASAPPSSPKTPKRPGAPHRSHSFCASGSNTTYALASACTSGHLSSDKRKLVAPPLERTLSSIGSKGNTSPPNQQMQRPFPGARQMSAPLLRTQMTPTKARPVLAAIDGLLNDAKTSPSPPTPLVLPPAPSPTASIPTIMIHTSVTPPRPSLATFRNSSTASTASSRSSSYTNILTPSTPRAVLFGSIEESDTEDEVEEGSVNVKSDIHLMAGAVEELTI